MNRRTPPDWLLVLLLAVGVFLWQRTVFPPWMCDLFHIQYAAYQFRAGETEWMYTTRSHWDEWLLQRRIVGDKLGAEGDPNADYYPPFVPALLSPLADVRATVWRDAVLGLNVALLGAFAVLIVRACSTSITVRSLLWALTLVLIAYPTARAAQLGQTLPLLAVLVWVALLALRENRPIRAGALLGIVGAIKIFPLAFVAVPLVERRRRAVLVAVATVALIFAASLAVLGVRIHELWWAALQDIGSIVYPFYGNQSLSGWYARAVMGCSTYGEDFAPPLAILLLRAASLVVFGGATAWTLWRSRARHDRALFVPRAGLIISAVLLCLPVAWEHYWLFALPALAWAIQDAWRYGGPWYRQAHLATAAFFFTMKLTRFYGSHDPLACIISGSQTVGMLMLWLWLVWRLEHDRPRQVAA